MKSVFIKKNLYPGRIHIFFLVNSTGRPTQPLTFKIYLFFLENVERNQFLGISISSISCFNQIITFSELQRAKYLYCMSFWFSKWHFFACKITVRKAKKTFEQQNKMQSSEFSCLFNGIDIAIDNGEKIKGIRTVFAKLQQIKAVM